MCIEDLKTFPKLYYTFQNGEFVVIGKVRNGWHAIMFDEGKICLSDVSGKYQSFEELIDKIVKAQFAEIEEYVKSLHFLTKKISVEYDEEYVRNIVLSNISPTKE